MCDRNDAMNILDVVYRECSRIYSGRVSETYLYGSYARGDYTAESDIDILLVVDMSAEEIAKRRPMTAKVSSALSLEHDVTVSVTVKPMGQFNAYADMLPFYKNVVREGVRYAV